MDDDDKELVCHFLFAKANELAETTHDAAVSGHVNAEVKVRHFDAAEGCR